MDIPVCILAGGLSKRLRPLTETIPKPMAPIGDKPFLQLVLEHFASLGFRRYVLAVSYLWEQIRDHFGDGSRFGWRIEYSVEAEPLDTGGAVRYAQSLWGTCAVVANGDTFVPEDWRGLVAIQERSGLPVAMSLVWQDDCDRFGRVEVRDDRVVGFVEKGRHAGAGWINAGVYVLQSTALDGFERGQRFSLERDVFPRLIGRIAAYRCGKSFADIGTAESLAQFRQTVHGGGTNA
ncbi:MAG: nucleotidyltransferase family protein [Phycisphaerae bacterium]|nr:nucleotidyltransferase family protein [Phycisphaerae bacterium]